MERQSQFKYKVAEITSDRMGDQFTLDVRPLIVELVFFESLDKPYVTGQIAISDDQAIFDSITFSGTERINIQMMSELSASENEDVVMDRSFILTGIDTIVKSSNSGSSSIYVFSFMDEHAMISKTKNISRSVKDDLNTEILKLCGNECGADVDMSYASESVQGNFRGIIPYMHPLEAASWLCGKATTNLGMPFFLYGTVFTGKEAPDAVIRLGSLDKMLEQPAWNEDIPFLFSPANTQKQELTGDPTSQYFQVQSMKSTSLQNTFKQLQTGGIGSRYTVTDISNGRNTSQHFSIDRMIDQANEAGLIDKTKQNIYDPEYKTPDFDVVNISGDHLHDTDAQIFHNVVSRGVYGDKKSLHDEVSPSMFLKKIENLAYRNAIYKNMIDVTLPGPGFIKSGGTVGDKIKINVLNDDNGKDGGLDRLRSGDFLVYNTRHTFKNARHDVALTVFKLEKGSK